MREPIIIRQIVDESVSKFKDGVAFQMKRGEGYRKWSYEEVGRQIVNLAANLASLGISRGDKVAVLSENRPEWPISYFAINYLGATVVPLDALISAADHIFLLKDSGAKGIILSQKFLDEIKSKFGELQECGFIVCMDHEKKQGDILSFVELTEKASAKPPEVKVALDDLASIVYTSGTTGVAKGVMLTNRNIASNLFALAELFPMIGPEDNFLSVLPLHHTFETTTGMFCPFYMGSTITYAEGLKSHILLANMVETGVTIMLGVPLLYRLFYDGIKRGVEEKGAVAKVLFAVLFAVSKFFKRVLRLNIGRHLFSMVHKKLGGNVRFWVSGAAAIDPEVIRGFGLMGITILQGYGLTESAPVLTCCTLKNDKVGSVGRAVPGVEIKLENKDESGSGEIIAKGPNIMKGYYKKPEITAETIRDGWLYTGDIGRVDRDGYVYITGRFKDVIVTGSGLNVYPEEVEIELAKSPAVGECCVLGRKIKEGMRKGMEEVVAVIIPNAEYFKDRGEINSVLREEIGKVNKKLPDFKNIGDIIVREQDFPKTSTKKIKRYVLRKELGFV